MSLFVTSTCRLEEVEPVLIVLQKSFLPKRVWLRRYQPDAMTNTQSCLL
jgi:hypothetical protein